MWRSMPGIVLRLIPARAASAASMAAHREAWLGASIVVDMAPVSHFEILDVFDDPDHFADISAHGRAFTVGKIGQLGNDHGLRSP